MHVTVLDSYSGRPMQRVRVRVGPPADSSAWYPEVDGNEDRLRTAMTGIDGSCILNVPLSGVVTVYVLADRYIPYESQLSQIHVPARMEHVAHLVRGGSVEVTVVDPYGNALDDVQVDHEPPSGAPETFTLTNTLTNEDGIATFRSLVPGRHRFRIAPDPLKVRKMSADEAKRSREGGWHEVDVVDFGRATLQLTRQ